MIWVALGLILVALKSARRSDLARSMAWAIKSLFIGVVIRIGFCSISDRNLLCYLDVGFARCYGSLGATFVEVRVGWEHSGDVNVGAQDNWWLGFCFKKGGRDLLLRILVGIDEVKANGGHVFWGLGWGWVAADNRAGAAVLILEELCALLGC